MGSGCVKRPDPGSYYRFRRYSRPDASACSTTRLPAHSAGVVRPSDVFPINALVALPGQSMSGESEHGTQLPFLQGMSSPALFVAPSYNDRQLACGKKLELSPARYTASGRSMPPACV